MPPVPLIPKVLKSSPCPAAVCAKVQPPPRGHQCTEAAGVSRSQGPVGDSPEEALRPLLSQLATG